MKYRKSAFNEGWTIFSSATFVPKVLLQKPLGKPYYSNCQTKFYPKKLINYGRHDLSVLPESRDRTRAETGFSIGRSVESHCCCKKIIIVFGNRQQLTRRNYNRHGIYVFKNSQTINPSKLEKISIYNKHKMHVSIEPTVRVYKQN